MPLADIELRVLGCLIEKEATTPDQYPLTLNALLAACNQKTNRDPVVDYIDADVIEAIGSLRDRGLCRLTHVPGQRAVKYKHALDSALDLRAPELALLAVLLLRGDQTPGELRARTSRYHTFSSPAEVESTLEHLAQREPPLVSRLARRPGEKESRWRHLLGGGQPDPGDPDVAPASSQPTSAPSLEERVTALEAEVTRLKEMLEAGPPEVR